MRRMQNTADWKQSPDHLELKIKKIPDLSTRIKSKISKKEMITMKRRSKKNLTYISWLDNERRLRNLITP